MIISSKKLNTFIKKFYPGGKLYWPSNINNAELVCIKNKTYTDLFTLIIDEEYTFLGDLNLLWRNDEILEIISKRLKSDLRYDDLPLLSEIVMDSPIINPTKKIYKTHILSTWNWEHIKFSSFVYSCLENEVIDYFSFFYSVFDYLQTGKYKIYFYYFLKKTNFCIYNKQKIFTVIKSYVNKHEFYFSLQNSSSQEKQHKKKKIHKILQVTKIFFNLLNLPIKEYYTIENLKQNPKQCFFQLRKKINMYYDFYFS